MKSSDMNTMRACVIQMNSGNDVDANLQDVLRLMELACREHAPRVIVLPENFLSFGVSALSSMQAKLESIKQTLAEFCMQWKVDLIAGSIPHRLGADKAKPRFYSRCLHITAEGSVAAEYDKIHLFDVDVADGHGQYRESDTYQSGDRIVSSAIDGYSVGLSICYDLRFSGMYQALRDQGVQVLTVPAAFTAVTGEAHWEILLRARAVETQCFVLAANQWGDHGKGRSTWGHSMIIDPWGKVLAKCDNGTGYCVADLDMNLLVKVRKDLPIAKHRRPRLYGER